MRFEHWLYTMPLRLRSLFRRPQVERDLDDELAYHLERKAEEYVAQGMTPNEARQAALRSIGGLTQRKEECRDVWGVNAIENTVRDVRYSLRVLAKSPAFTLVAVATLALAIGANTVAFGVFNGLILRPLDVPQAETLWGTTYGDGSGWQSYPNYVDLRDRNRSFEDLAAFKFVFVGLDLGKETVRATAFAATGNYFDALKVQPFLGRFFHASDERGPDSAPYIVLTWPFWNARFHGDRAVVGRTIRINKHPFTIVGVAPRTFHGTLSFVTPDFFFPIVNQRVEGWSYLTARGTSSGVFEAFGHLKPGVTPAQALADVNAVGAYLRKTYPNESGRKTSFLSRPGLTSFGRPARAFVAGITALAGLILLAACANLGSLFAARAADRSREVALRLALGASRARILRQLLTEAVLVSLAGAAAGLAGSVALLGRLSLWQPFSGAPVHLPVEPDARIYAVALVLALVSAFLFGIIPVRQALRTDPYQIVKTGPAGAPGRRLTVRDALLAVQIAICAVLVTSSLVAVRGLVRSLDSKLGFDPRNTMLANLNLSIAGYTGDDATVVQKRIIEALKTIPGVERVGLVNGFPPLAYAAGNRANVFLDRATDLRSSNAAVRPYTYEVSPEYFRAVGTALLAGRDFTWRDDMNAPAVAVVNRAFAGRIFAGVAKAVGGYFKAQNGTRVQVVGVVEDGKYMSLTEDQEPAMFLSFLREPSGFCYVAVRSARDPQQLGAAMRSKLRELDAGLPVDVETWDSLLELVLFPARVATIALGALGAMGAILSITGVFGMAAYSVSRRLRELGIRIALGAQRREVLHAALGRAFQLLAFGSAAGLFLGILASRVLASIVYQATPRDPVVLTGVVLVMVLLGLLATWIPAHRALSLDPLRLLREE
jgi:predicted permease